MSPAHKKIYYFLAFRSVTLTGLLLVYGTNKIHGFITLNGFYADWFDPIFWVLPFGDTGYSVW